MSDDAQIGAFEDSADVYRDPFVKLLKRILPIAVTATVLIVFSAAGFMASEYLNASKMRLVVAGNDLYKADKASADLELAIRDETIAKHELTIAKLRENEARLTGNLVEQRELAAQISTRESIVQDKKVAVRQREGDVARQKEADARKAGDLATANRMAEEARNREQAALKETGRLAAERAAAERASAEKLAAEKQQVRPMVERKSRFTPEQIQEAQDKSMECAAPQFYRMQSSQCDRAAELLSEVAKERVAAEKLAAEKQQIRPMVERKSRFTPEQIQEARDKASDCMNDSFRMRQSSQCSKAEDLLNEVAREARKSAGLTN